MALSTEHTGPQHASKERNNGAFIDMHSSMTRRQLLGRGIGVLGLSAATAVVLGADIFRINPLDIVKGDDTIKAVTGLPPDGSEAKWIAFHANSEDTVSSLVDRMAGTLGYDESSDRETLKQAVRGFTANRLGPIETKTGPEVWATRVGDEVFVMNGIDQHEFVQLPDFVNAD